MLMLSDELAALFLNMSRYSGGQDNEFWLEAWNGNAYNVERMGRTPISVDHLLVGVVGGLQPDKLARSFKGDLDGRNRKSRMLNVGFDFRRIEMNERCLTAFAYKQLGAGDMIRCAWPLRDTYFVARQIGDILAVAIPTADTANVADVMA
jgi:hypothetical protein